MSISCRPLRLPALGLMFFLGGCAGWNPLSMEADPAPGPAAQSGGLANAMLRVADMAAAHDDWRTAASHYRRAADLSPDDPRPLTRLGSVLAMREQWRESEAAFRAAVARDPDSPDAKRGLARLEERRLANRDSRDKAAESVLMQNMNKENITNKKQNVITIFSENETGSVLPADPDESEPAPAPAPAADGGRFPAVTAADLMGFDDRPPAVLPISAPEPPDSPPEAAPDPADPAGNRQVRAETASMPGAAQKTVDGPESVDGPGYQVQIAAYQTDPAARAALARLTASLRAETAFRVERADLGPMGVFFRLRTAVPVSKDAARQFCDDLRGLGQDCFIARAARRA